MTFNPSRWYPIATVLSLINLAAVPFATTPPHTASHAVLAVLFALWADRLRRRKVDNAAELPARMDSLEIEITRMRQELSETQERLDFAERVLVQGKEERRVGPEP